MYEYTRNPEYAEFMAKNNQAIHDMLLKNPHMIQEGLGVAIVTTTSLSLSVLPPNVRVRTIKPQPFREIQLAVPSLKEASHGVKLFLQTARELYLSGDRNR